ncbi:CDP-diacylglycerol--glycerol-3-phosphate 3-phosphatidyltransferase [Symmachiella dynata]|uniref:CDP-diacylglycerol--glycerol-3-phosphate 3-phosphatidyltransferase n=1 Tax=Symmachiella dynata TaxID=2527995 RepID=A0A517ZNA8_9PLAN|nr:CDP-diacylglycerol--glycerol-3-phosphate 3-phosphatidyltransferase [Symmachiella dynata]QDU43951.1 CDP-diacylglycerol--glycerol-3-phosphate 3-phosphatidyltransferase [Symmachiella dynata]
MATTKPEKTSTASDNHLGRNSLNWPNAITMSRLILAIVLFALIDYRGYWKTSVVVFVIAAATDALDGFIARRYGMVTVLGRILDPFVDKFIICGAFIFLLAKTGSGINAWMVMIVIGREMFVTGLRGFLEQQGKDFSAAWSGKIKMALQCVAVAASLMSLAPEITESPSADQFFLLRDILLWGAIISTVWSGLIYIVRGAKLLRQG